MKKIRLIISLLLILITTQVHTFAAPRIPVYKVGNVLYFFDKSTGTITGFAGEPSDVNLPSSLGGYKVISIGSRAFAGSPTLRSVGIPQGVTTISAEAFASCPKLSSVEIATSVSYIGSKAFANNPSLSTVYMLGAPDYIELDAFDNTDLITNTGLEFVILGGSTLMQYNGSSETVTVPYGVKNIAFNAFANNHNLKKVILPDTIEKIGDNAFFHCSNLSSLEIPASVSHIGTGAFDGTLWLKNHSSDFVTVNGILVYYKGDSPHVYVPDGTTAIGSGAFMANEKIRSIHLPDSVVYIDSMAFGSCNELRLVTIPNNVVWIDEFAFSGCFKETIHAEPYSYAYSYATYMGIPTSAPVSISLNGQKTDFDNVAPIIKDDRTYLPLRALMEMMGYTVSWDQGTGNVTCIKGDKTVTITPGGDIYVNGVISEVKAVPINIYGSNVVPARFVSEAVNAQIEWIGETRTVNISY